MEKNIEFEEMKQQLHLLQQRLDKQVEINERQTRRAIEDGMGIIRQKDRHDFILCLLLALVCPLIELVQSLPIHFVLATFALLLVNATAQYLISLDNRKLAGMNLLEAAKILVSYKKNKNRSILIGLPLALCWVCWYWLEISKIAPLADEDIVVIPVCMFIGVSIGFAIGMKLFYLPKMRAADHLLRQIEEVQGEK